MLLAVSCLAIVFGALLAARAHLPAGVPVLFALAFVALALLLWLKTWRRVGLSAAALAFLFLGLARGSCSPPQSLTPGDLAALEGQRVVAEGAVRGDPERVGDSYRFRLRGTLWVPEASASPPLRGDVLVTLRPWKQLVERRQDGSVRYGDVLRLEGQFQLLEPFGAFDYRSYLAHQGLLGALRHPRATLVDEGRGLSSAAALFSVRRRMAEALQHALPEPQAALAQALLVGFRRELPTDVQQDFVRTGTMHLLSISGLHVSVLLTVLLGAAQGLGGRRRRFLLVPLIGVWVYALLSGASPPVLRAALMGTLVLWSQYEGRPSAGALALAFAAALMVAVTPRLLFDLSFQLSFAAMAGLVLLAPPIQRLMARGVAAMLGEDSLRNPVATGLIGAVAAGVAATLASLPLTAFYFQRFSVVGVPITLLTLPVLPFGLAAIGGTALAGLAWAPLGAALGWVAWLPLTFLLKLVQVSAAPGWVAVEGSAVAPWIVGAYYMLLLGALPLVQRAGRAPARSVEIGSGEPSDKKPPARIRQVLTQLGPLARSPWPLLPEGLWERIPKKAIALVLFLSGAMLWTAALSLPPRGLLRVAFLDVGQGDAILVVTPSGRQVLVDGGPEPRRLLQHLGERLPFWDRTLDVIALTHPQQDHLGGLGQAVARYQPQVVLERFEGTSAAYLEWRRLVTRRAGQRVEAQAGHEVDLGDGALLQVLHPPERLLEATGADANNNALVLRLVYGQIAFLLTGDIEQIAERSLVDQSAPLHATVLKAPHHGSRSSSSAPFLAAVGPRVVVVSVGQDNPFGHPHSEVVEALSRVVPPGQLLTTAEHGTIELVTDGRRLWMKMER